MIEIQTLWNWSGEITFEHTTKSKITIQQKLEDK